MKRNKHTERKQANKQTDGLRNKETTPIKQTIKICFLPPEQVSVNMTRVEAGDRGPERGNMKILFVLFLSHSSSYYCSFYFSYHCSYFYS